LSFASCLARGGGEYGESWHADGSRRKKLHTVEDTIACAEHLISTGLAGKGRIILSGDSAGAIAVGGAFLRHPELFAGLILNGPIANLERFETTSVGKANAEEFGTMADPEDAAVIQSVDLVRLVRPGVKYPPVLVTVGLNDTRVPPWQGAKLVARLQEAGGSRAAHLRIEKEAGHLVSTNEQRLKRNIDNVAFAFSLAGVSGFAPNTVSSTQPQSAVEP
jgi:prolyl oligopeptidase